MYYKIDKTEDEVVHIALRKYQGRQFLDIRQHYRDDEGEFKPTKKGCTLPPCKIIEVIEALQAIQEELHREEETD